MKAGPRGAEEGPGSLDEARPWPFACPVCRNPLSADDPPGSARCETCNRPYSLSSGIWRFLPDQQAATYQQFLHEYQIVRADEGWGGAGPDYYRSLPLVAPDDPQREIWGIRAKSYRELLDRVVAPLEAQSTRPMSTLDIGAGNCWLSYRLAQRAHWVAAVDVSESPTDGLGAHVWYQDAEKPGDLAGGFTPVQAEFDHLPFRDSQMDLVVFNASLHYSTDCAATLIEAARVLSPTGSLVIMDSPMYDDPSSGERMVQEREATFEQKYGFRSNSLPAEHFLTRRRMDELAAAVGLRWEVLFPFYGVAWMMRPWRAKLRGHREPAKLPLIVGTPEARTIGNANVIAG
jgi:SAM-dependent methyltransferase